MLILIAVFQHSTLEAIILPTCEEQETVCKEIKENIKKTIKSQDYIYEFLDEM
jgi:ADP-dependent phosphofructokinase/glucokinase